MKSGALPFIMISLGGCSDFYHDVFGPSDQQVAQFCGVSVPQLKQARLRVKKMESYKGASVGKCFLIKDDGGEVIATSITETPPPATPS